jgi:predicted RNA-binding Zn ribbon-like protein
MVMSPAPDGLRFVQDLVNTAVESRAYDPVHDRLASPRAAREWLRGALEGWAAATGSTAPVITLRPDELAGVQELRERLRAALRATAANAEAPTGGAAAGGGSEGGGPGFVALGGDLKLAAGRDGRVRYLPASADARAIAELVAAETLLAQARGTWPLLKACANPVCGVCFYDTSPNRSRVWHDTRICGNRTNLRASRARRRTA